MKTAIILFNLGGPDGAGAVQPFLFNLFNDPAIIGAPKPIRWALAHYVSRKRAPKAQAIYARIGGASPLVPQTLAQAAALEKVLGDQFKCFLAMRYWHPMTEQAAIQARDWGAERVILLPLYPQFSFTTTRSSQREWHRVVTKMGWRVPTESICCYPTQDGWIQALADLTGKALDQAPNARILFSAHGLPQQIVDAGDPYPDQVMATAQAVMNVLGSHRDFKVCYQSRVGPLKWIGPATEDELARAGRDKVAVILVPVAFVSEHSETLVELDMEYAELAAHAGVPDYIRVPTVSTHPRFVAGLADLVRGEKSGCTCKKGCA